MREHCYPIFIGRKFRGLRAVSIDVEEVIGALKRDDLSLLVGGETTSIPPWFDWLVWLGQWMRVQAALEGRRVAVVRMPSRRLGAAATAVGTVFASARLHDDSLDWEGLRGLHPGTKIFWRETASGRSTRRSGTVAGLRQIAGSDFMEVVVEAQKSTRLFAKAAALSYGITVGSVSAQADERLASAERVIRSASTDVAQGWMRSPAIECTIITERSSFLSDLDSLAIRAGASVEASCSDLLAIAGSGGRSHGKTRIAPARSDGILDESGFITILDGASAAVRMGDTIARSVVILLDQSEYDEEVEQLLQTFLGFAVDAHVHAPANGVRALPASIEAIIFGLPLQFRSQT
jgi:hypothetical protein